MKNFTKFIPRKVRKNLVKEVILYDVSYDKSFLTYHLELKRFMFPIQKIEVVLIVNDDCILIPYSYDKKRLELRVPINLILKISTNAKINLKINNKLLVINSIGDFNEEHGVKVVGERCIATKVNKSIILTKRLEVSNSLETDYEVHNLKSTYECMSFNINNIYYENDYSNLKIYAVSQKSVRILIPKLDKYGKLVINDLSTLSSGKWMLFINIKEKSYPLKLDKDIKEIFSSLNHTGFMNANTSGNMMLTLLPHVLNVDKLYLSNDKEHLNVLIQSNDFHPSKQYRLNMNDRRLSKDFELPLTRTHQGYETQYNLKDLSNSFYNKRFFVISDDPYPIKYQMNITGEEISEFRFQEVINNQLVTFEFYKRKDKSLGLKYQIPVIKKCITDIKGLKVSGYISNVKDNFPDCKTFLYLEERNTKKALKIPIAIDNEFVIELDEKELISIKSKGKTLFDFFILLTDYNGEIIRKEKIKYEHANYKKDNYYEHITTIDEQSNNHHFLFTTTPFDNLKIETFVIPNYINVPDNTIEKNNNLWLIGERTNTAQDNGIALFRWLKNNTDVEVYYVIEANSDDYKKIINEKNVITFGSIEHYEVAFKARVLLCTHDFENILPYKPARGFFHYEETYKVFLQHGVLGRKNVEYHKKYYNLPFDLFVVSSDTEKDKIVIEEMGYAEEEVVTTGLARFDYLTQNEKPQDILLMPTWRDWINTDDQFIKSEYHNRYISLLKSEKLLNLLEEYNCILNFYPHYRAQEYFIREFNDYSDRVNFIKLGSKTVQQLLIEHSLLITDYSSVSFDFILMNKPVIYYHFDVKRFFRKGILRPVEETFIGEIATNEENLVNYIEQALKSNMAKNFNDITGVIKYQDIKNSERIFNEVNSRLS